MKLLNPLFQNICLFCLNVMTCIYVIASTISILIDGWIFNAPFSYLLIYTWLLPYVLGMSFLISFKYKLPKQFITLFYKIVWFMVTPFSLSLLIFCILVYIKQ